MALLHPFTETTQLLAVSALCTLHSRNASRPPDLSENVMFIVKSDPSRKPVR